MLEDWPIASFIIGNKPITKLIQVFQPTIEFNFHMMAQEMEMGVLQHNLTDPKERTDDGDAKKDRIKFEGGGEVIASI